jgi:hypothetical protein
MKYNVPPNEFQRNDMEIIYPRNVKDFAVLKIDGEIWSWGLEKNLKSMGCIFNDGDFIIPNEDLTKIEQWVSDKKKQEYDEHTQKLRSEIDSLHARRDKARAQFYRVYDELSAEIKKKKSELEGYENSQ